MRFKLLAVLAIMILALFSPIVSLAAEGDVEGDVEGEETVEVQSEFNSFEAFWPIAAGKTVGDPLFFLKTFKEKVRGLIIFSNAKKSEYALFLATKRAVEAEKLINEGKEELARKTLTQVEKHLDSSLTLAEKAISKAEDFGSDGQMMADRARNIDLLAKWLEEKNKGKYDLLTVVSQKATALADRLEGK